MTFLDKLIELLAMHGVDGRGYDRIDVALEKLYEVEKKEHQVKAAPKTEEKKTKAKKETDEHAGI